jgi:hypothetical protein
LLIQRVRWTRKAVRRADRAEIHLGAQPRATAIRTPLITQACRGEWRQSSLHAGGPAGPALVHQAVREGVFPRLRAFPARSSNICTGRPRCLNGLRATAAGPWPPPPDGWPRCQVPARRLRRRTWPSWPTCAPHASRSSASGTAARARSSPVAGGRRGRNMGNPDRETGGWLPIRITGLPPYGRLELAWSERRSS